MSRKATLKDVMRQLEELNDPKVREANESRGDDHGVNLTQLRGLAKRLKTQHDLAVQLWATGATAACLLTTLICKPKAFSADKLDAMIREIRAPKLLNWFIVNVVKHSRHVETLRLAWTPVLPGRTATIASAAQVGASRPRGSPRTLRNSTSRRCSIGSRRR